MKMKPTRFLCVALALSLGASSLAFGQGRGNRDRDRDGIPDRVERGDRNSNGVPDRAERHDNGRHLGWSNNKHDRYPGYHRWNRGDRLPPEYRDRQYVVNDWRGHHLNAPPRGYQWVQVGNDYLLVALATGLISQLLAGR